MPCQVRLAVTHTHACTHSVWPCPASEAPEGDTSFVLPKHNSVGPPAPAPACYWPHSLCHCVAVTWFPSLCSGDLVSLAAYTPAALLTLLAATTSLAPLASSISRERASESNQITTVDPITSSKWVCTGGDPACAMYYVSRTPRVPCTTCHILHPSQELLRDTTTNKFVRQGTRHP